MRTPVLSRSLIALASLAVGASTLAAVPATAATPSGISREQVLTVASGIRATYASGDSPPPATIKAARSIVIRGCAVNADDGEIVTDVNVVPTVAGASADGAVVFGRIVNIVDGTTRSCALGAVAASAPAFALSGSVTLSVPVTPGDQVRTVTAPLSGDVATTPVVHRTGAEGFGSLPTMSATGAATQTIAIPATTVKDKKTKAEKRAAKKRYAKKLKALRTSYDRAIKKAGGSTTKKAAAKKRYNAKKKTAKAAYRYAIANYRIVKKARTTQDVRPFTVTLLTF